MSITIEKINIETWIGVSMRVGNACHTLCVTCMCVSEMHVSTFHFLHSLYAIVPFCATFPMMDGKLMKHT